MLKPEITSRLTTQFKGELDAYCAYKELYMMVKEECPMLSGALEEIMYDEYLHARFIREYMMSKDAYKSPVLEELERKYLQIEEE